MDGNLPRALGIAKAEVRRAAEFFARRSMARCGETWHEVCVHLTDDAGSAEYHRAIMGIDGATDVITQAYDPLPPEEDGLSGELFVNTDAALREAPKRAGWSAAKELLLYIAHGMDHLSGADDLEPSGRKRMRRRELAWLAAARQAQTIPAVSTARGREPSATCSRSPRSSLPS